MLGLRGNPDVNQFQFSWLLLLSLNPCIKYSHCILVKIVLGRNKVWAYIVGYIINVAYILIIQSGLTEINWGLKIYL